MGVMYLIGMFIFPIILALVIYRVLAIILGQTLIFSKITGRAMNRVFKIDWVYFMWHNR